MSLNDLLKTFNHNNQKSLIALLDRHLIKKAAVQQENSTRAKGVIHPSQIHSCPKAIVFSIIEAAGQSPVPPKLTRIFDNGHYVHDRIQKYLIDAGLIPKDKNGRYMVEVGLRSDSLNISGSADGIVEIDGKRYVLEIKSINGNSFSSLREPKEEHVIQVNCYMLVLGLEGAVILYENKDNQEMKEFFVKKDKKVCDWIIERCNEVNEALARREFPDGICTGPSDPDARYCPFASICFLDKDFKEYPKEGILGIIDSKLPPKYSNLRKRKS
jgi:hypothetical protein